MAGTGKSTMLMSAREAWQAQVYRVHGAALAAKAAEGLEESFGIASRTLASWERGWERGFDKLGPGDVFVIDEAELNPVENIWEYLLSNAFGHQVWETYEAILDACCDAWNSITKIPDLIKSIARRKWAEVRI